MTINYILLEFDSFLPQITFIVLICKAFLVQVLQKGLHEIVLFANRGQDLVTQEVSDSHISV